MTPQATKTLIVIHGDKYLEVFSNERSQVKIVNVPNMTSIAGELAIEELLSLRLPPYWAKVYTDGHLVDRDAIRDVTAADIMARDNNVALVRTMNRHIVPAGNALVKS